MACTGGIRVESLVGRFSGSQMQRTWRTISVRAEPHLHIWTFLAAVLLCGLVFGGIVAGQLNSSDTAVLGHAVQRLLLAVQQHQLAASGDLWWQRVIGDGQLLALIWLFGVSVIGLPFVVIAIFLRAFSVGFSVGFTVLQFGWKGFVLATLGIFVHQLLTLLVFVVAGGIAIRFSASILRHSLSLQAMPLAFLKYTGWFAVCTIGLMIGAWIQAYMAPQLMSNLLL